MPVQQPHCNIANGPPRMQDKSAHQKLLPTTGVLPTRISAQTTMVSHHTHSARGTKQGLPTRQTSATQWQTTPQFSYHMRYSTSHSRSHSNALEQVKAAGPVNFSPSVECRQLTCTSPSFNCAFLSMPLGGAPTLSALTGVARGTF